MAAAAPFALKAGASLLGGWLGKKMSGPSKEQKAGLQGAQQGATTLSGFAGPLMSQGMQFGQQAGQNLSAASQYYQGVMGNRQQAMSHLSPEISSIMDYYRGGSNKIGRNLRGGSRDYALAEMERQKVGQVAGLIPQARRTAAEGLGQLGGQYGALGSSMTGQGVNAASNAAQASNQLYGMGADMQRQQQEGGNVMGGMIYDILKDLPFGKAKIPSTPSPGMFGTSAPQLLGQNRPY